MRKIKIVLLLSGFTISMVNNYSISDNSNCHYDIFDSTKTPLLKQDVAYSYDTTYEDDYFKIKYDSNYNNLSQVSDLLNLFNKARIGVDILGYRQNFSIEHGNKYLIELCPNTHPKGYVATTTGIYDFGNKREDKIIFYNLTGVNQQIKETIFHEYFHSIQDNYNLFYTSGQSSRFVEACADWAKYKLNDDTYLCNSRLLNYMNDDYKKSIFETTGYQEVALPFTLEKMFDQNIIRKIYEYMDSLSEYQSFTSLKNVINTVLKNEYNSKETFDTVFKNMSSSIISIKNNFTNCNINYDDNIFYSYNNTNSLAPVTEVDYSIKSYSNAYYKLSLPSNVNYHDINIKIDSTYQNVYYQLYVIDSLNNHYIIPIEENNDVYSYNLKGLSSSINKVYLVTTNCENSSVTINLNLTYTNHNFKNHYCTLCGEYLENHLYTSKYMYSNKTSHYAYCGCGEYVTTAHVVNSNDTSIKKTCIYCGATGIFGIIKE